MVFDPLVTGNYTILCKNNELPTPSPEGLASLIAIGRLLMLLLMTAKVTVVLPVYNGETTLGDCLRALQCQTLSKSDYQVIVAIDHATRDSSADIVRRFNTQIVMAERHGAAAARNAGLAASNTEWIAFTDDDCIPSRAWLSTLLRAVGQENDSEGAFGVAGRTYGFESHAAAARFVDLTGGLDAYTHLMHPKFPFAPLGNVMYRREALSRLEGFDERYWYGEAIDLHYRLLQIFGGRFLFEPRAVVFHRHPASWKAYCQQQFYYGRGLGQFMFHHKDVTEWSRLRELRGWGKLAGLGIRACVPAKGDAALVRRGTFVKQVAQRLGFITSYWNPVERRKWG
jgi:GT2 family glycosyltransferase